jgi:hypothetical protein
MSLKDIGRNFSKIPALALWQAGLHRYARQRVPARGLAGRAGAGINSAMNRIACIITCCITT